MELGLKSAPGSHKIHKFVYFFYTFTIFFTIRYTVHLLLCFRHLVGAHFSNWNICLIYFQLQTLYSVTLSASFLIASLSNVSLSRLNIYCMLFLSIACIYILYTKLCGHMTLSGQITKSAPSYFHSPLLN